MGIWFQGGKFHRWHGFTQPDLGRDIVLKHETLDSEEDEANQRNHPAPVIQRVHTNRIAGSTGFLTN